MPETEFTIETNTGAYDLTASVRRIGDDVLVAIWGGEKPHIGAVAIAQPRPSLKDPQAISATASVICLVGHKEDDLAKAAAEILAATHWDNLDPDAIERIIRNSETLVDMILAKWFTQFPAFKK